MTYRVQMGSLFNHAFPCPFTLDYALMIAIVTGEIVTLLMVLSFRTSYV